MRSRSPMLPIVVVAVSLAGCTSVGAGTPTPAGTTATTSVAASGLPARPREVSLKGLTGQDMCNLITVDQRRQLNVDVGNVRPRENGSRSKEPSCALNRIDAAPYIEVDPFVVTSEDITNLVGRRGNTEGRPVVIGGFPAVESNLVGVRDECYAHIGVAAGQVLGVQATEPSEAMSMPEICALARRAAGMALENLLKLRP
ncbi:DUF3558 domain-containing protein [Allokutzneria oryzae]|uniref:DUF3558 domain-containing protein n=1 Tax=Allokutzneria oryzae TaxID=1378989 RepID=A0ABV5ZT70_9PSEU